MDIVSYDVGSSTVNATEAAGNATPTRRILGIDFFTGGAQQAIERMRRGGLLVAPAAPGLTNLPLDPGYRQALVEADVAITDSAFMVMVWNMLEGDTVKRVSGLEYFSRLIEDPDFRQDASALYVMSSEKSARKNVGWLASQGICLEPEQVYIAPIYGRAVTDSILVERVLALRSRHVVITVGGGVQERLGLYLKRSLDYVPAIHCIGAAIAFRSGDQVSIPKIVDTLALTWLIRCLWSPKNYVPRYWSARKLAWLLFRYRDQLPPLRVATAQSPSASTT